MDEETLDALIATDPIKKACYELGKQRAHVIGQSYSDPAIIRAAQALYDLRYAMQDVRQTVPTHMPGTEPTAADNCRQVLDMIEYGIKNIGVYLQVPVGG